MFSLRTDIMMIEFFSSLRRMTELDSMDCPECSGPPPIFRLPPPPRPPFLTESAFCSEAPLAELEDCIAIPMIDASYQANPSLQNTALIITCTVILLLMAAVVSVVFWKHKRKVQNILPCKSAAAAAAAAAAGGRGMVLPNGQSLPGSGNAARLYEDLLGNSHHSDIHSNLPVQLGIQPTIEVRAIDRSRQQITEHILASHHLDYLDYRDPRSILCASKKPSRAILGGGYRTPQAILANSNKIKYESQLKISKQSPSTPTANNISILSNQQSRYNQRLIRNDDRLINRRLSIDSDGYAYIDINDSIPTVRNSINKCRMNIYGEENLNSELYQTLLRPSTTYSNSNDMIYSTIDPTVSSKIPPHHLQIPPSDPNDDSVCPLCTIQEIHHLLTLPSDNYLPTH